jgi:serine/threonine-protein kinase HipA
MTLSASAGSGTGSRDCRRRAMCSAIASAANEATCLRLAAACGLDVPDIELLDLDGLGVLAVKRYDRRPSPDGPVRVHQEDGCQATSTPPQQKYEEQGGPSLRDFALCSGTSAIPPT